MVINQQPLASDRPQSFRVLFYYLCLMATVLFTDTLTQNIGESDTDFSTRVQQYVSDQQYYFEQVGGSFPSPRADQSGYLGFPPSGPCTSTIVYDPTNTQLVRQVTFAYDNIYYYKYLNTTPSIPPPSPLPISGDIAIFASNGALTDGQIGIDTVSLNFTNLLPATINGQAVEYSQFAAAIAGLVPSSRTLSINGIGYDLSDDRSWSVGTVTGFSSGDLSPIFTTSVATATTTPALSFSLSTQSANTIFAGPSTPPNAAPTFRSMVLGDLPSGVGLTDNPLSQFAATTSSELASVISDETGTGSVMFGTSPTVKTSLKINNPTNTFAYEITPGAIASNLALNLPITRQAETLAIRPVVYAATPPDPSNISSTTYKMLGLAGTYTPQVTGTVLITIGGRVQCSGVAAVGEYQISYGTGTAPANNDSVTGTQIGAIGSELEPTTTNTVYFPFSLSFPATGLTPGTTYWIDLAVRSTAGNMAFANIFIIAHEL